MEKRKQVAIIGGGPSGLMAAEVLGLAGHAVTIYDQMPSLGRKFLMAGRGGLNLTHSEPLDGFLTRYGEAAEWITPYINAFPPKALVEWCNGLGQETFIGSSGRVFPKSMKAAPLLRAWLRRLESLGVSYVARHRWLGFDASALRFKNAQGETVLVDADATLLALGGASWARLGSDGDWIDMLSDVGVEIVPLRPANGGFVVACSDYMKRFAGEPLKPLALTYNGVTKQGEAMVTAQGLEGGLMYAMSAPLREEIMRHGSVTMQMDLRPGMSVDALVQKLDVARGNKSLSTYLRKVGFTPLAIALLREVTPAAGNLLPAELAGRLKTLPITLTDTTGLEKAISTAGGVARNAVNVDLMLVDKPGVFVAGEMLDWEAPTGGYLLQGCFSTAVAAAHGILKYGG